VLKLAQESQRTQEEIRKKQAEAAGLLDQATGTGTGTGESPAGTAPPVTDDGLNN
jgi:hypothetical protein